MRLASWRSRSCFVSAYVVWASLAVFVSALDRRGLQDDDRVSLRPSRVRGEEDPGNRPQGATDCVHDERAQQLISGAVPRIKVELSADLGREFGLCVFVDTPDFFLMLY